MAASNTITITQDDVNRASTTLATVRLGLGLDKPGAAKPFTPQLLDETIKALKAKEATSGANLVMDLTQAVAKSAPQLKVSESDMKVFLTDFPMAVNVLKAASSQPAAAAPAQASAAPAAQSEDIKKAETLLSSFGIKVGAVDGVRDAQFDKAVGDLKNLVKAVMPNVAISAGATLTANDLKVLKEGLDKFATSAEFQSLQSIRKGNIPANLDRLDALALKAGLAFETTEAGRIKFALEAKSEKDPALKAALAKIPPQILAQMPQILDGIGNANNRTALVKGLEAAYAAPAVVTSAAPPVVKPAVPAAKPSTPVSVSPAGTPAAAPVAAPTPEPTPEATSETPVVTAEPKPVSVDSAAQVQAASELLEQIMVDKINPMLDKFAGGFKMAGISPSDLLPVLTQADVGGEFGEKSQQMAATMIMGMKSLAGIKPPDGTYSEAIGKQLKMSILTDDKMEMVRSAFNIEKMSRQDADALLKDTEALKKSKEFYLFFQSLDTLDKAKKLDEKGSARSMTQQNLMLDGLSKFLDKSSWGQQAKAWLKDFFTNSKIGQMVGSILPMFGINIGRLWGDKNDAAGVDRAKPTLEKIYSGYIDDAQKTLGPNAAFKDVMAKTRENIMSDMNNSASFQAGMRMVFGNADKDKVKDAIDKALVEAGKQPNAEAAKQVFVNSLVEMGKQYRSGQEVDLDKALQLIGETRATAVSNGAQLDTLNLGGGATNPAQPKPETQVPPASAPANGVAPAQQKPAEGSAGTGGASSATPSPSRVSSGASNAPSTILPSNAATVAASAAVKQSNGITADMAANKIEAGDKELRFVYVPDPKDYSQKLIPSNGRVRDVLDVVSRNHEALKMSLDMGMIKDKSGAVIDKATKPACAILEELSIRAHVAQQLRNGDTVDLAKIDRKMDSSRDIVVISSYLKENGVNDADVQKFRKAAEALLADRTTDKAFVNTPQLNLVQVNAIIRQETAARDPNAVKVDPKDAHLYDLYKKANEGHGPNCVPLVIMGRVGDDGRIVTIDQDKAAGKDIKLDDSGNPEGYKVFVGIVDNNRDADKTNDVFKVLEAKDFVKNGMRIAEGDPSYDALRKNYTWSGPEHSIIDNYIKKSLCLNDPVMPRVEIHSSPVTTVDIRPEGQRDKIEPPKAVFEPVRPETRASSEAQVTAAAERPLPRRYEDLLKEPFRISANEARNLDGGKLNLDAEYAKLQKSVEIAARNGGKAIWTDLPAFRQGPYMITPLESQADRAKLGGDLVVSRMINGEMVHSVVDSKKDGIINPNEYKKVAQEGGSFFDRNSSPKDLAQRLKGENVRIGLDELLDTNISKIPQAGHRDDVGTPFGYMVIVSKQKDDRYVAESAFDKLFGVGQLKMDAMNARSQGNMKEAVPLAQKIESLIREYDSERMKRSYERVAAERQLVSAAETPNTRAFTSASAPTETADPIRVASQNFRDMGMTGHDEAFENGVGGYALQQRKGISLGASA